MAIKMYMLKMAKKKKKERKRAAEPRQLLILVSDLPILIILNSPKRFPVFGQDCREFQFPRVTCNVCNRIM